MAYKAVFFDFDGVLVDAGSLVWDVYNELRGAYRMKQYTDKESLLAATKRTVWRSLLAMGVRPWHIPGALLKIRRHLKHGYEPKLVPGMDKVIRQLAQENMTLFVVTSNMEHVVERTLAGYSLRRYFTKIIAGDLSGNKVPLLKSAAKELGLPLHTTVFVTDTEGDVQDAVVVGIPTLGVTWGFHSRQRLLNAGAEAVVSRPPELARVIAHG